MLLVACCLLSSVHQTAKLQALQRSVNTQTHATTNQQPNTVGDKEHATLLAAFEKQAVNETLPRDQLKAFASDLGTQPALSDAEVDEIWQQVGVSKWRHDNVPSTLSHLLALMCSVGAADANQRDSVGVGVSGSRERQHHVRNALELVDAGHWRRTTQARDAAGGNRTVNETSPATTRSK